MEIVLQTFGTTLYKENDILVVKNQEGVQKLKPSNIKSILVSKAAKITSDAIILCIEHNIDICFIDSIGQVKGRVWSVSYGSISNIRKNQIYFSQNKSGAIWIKELLIQKLQQQTVVLMSLSNLATENVATQKHLAYSIDYIEGYIEKLKEDKSEDLLDCAGRYRGWEGNASKHYFKAISEALPSQYSFEKRTKRPALDAFNAMLQQWAVDCSL